VARVATRRLIEAAAGLGPADRALLNLWVNHGLDDERLRALSGLSAAALARGRDHLVGGLSERLGLPPQDVRRALEEIVTRR
jgi:hypothetical protein